MPRYTVDKTTICKGCGKVFEAKRRGASSCSKECTSKIIREMRIAEHAGKETEAIRLRLEEKLTSKEICERLKVTKGWLYPLFRRAMVPLNDEIGRANAIGARWKNHEPIVDGKKKCGKCQQLLPLIMFGKNMSSITGLTNTCKDCSRKQYIKNPEPYIKKSREFRKNNPDLAREKDKQDYNKNKPKRIETSKVWAQNNPEKRKAIETRYRIKNQFKKNAKTAAYRASKKNATPKWLTNEHKQQINDIYKKCPKGFHVDHIIPINGILACGLHVPWNLDIKPAKENIVKSNKMFFSKTPENVGKCFQKKVRDSFLDQDIKLGAPVEKKASDFQLSFEPITTEHQEFIKRYEWLGTTGYSPKWCFTARVGSWLGGVVMISEPNAYTSDFPKNLQALICRGACASWTPKNLGSRLVMFAVKWMTKHTPKRVFYAYSDHEAGEIGTIYQACNFDYLGAGFGALEMIKLPNGKLVNQRWFTKTTQLKKWAKELNIEWLDTWNKQNGYVELKNIPKETLTMLKKYAKSKMSGLEVISQPSKSKYVMITGKNKKEEYELKKMKSWIPEKYPKRNE